MNYLNLGCGKRFHSSWVNVNFTSSGTGVIATDLVKGIPFSDSSFDVVYHSHLLEHFSKAYAPVVIQECFRVLRSGGIIRVVVPDLEQIILCYLQFLQKITNGNVAAKDDYDWIMLELYDQVVRNSSGGQMASYLNRESIPNRDFIVKRCGVEVENLMRQFELHRVDKQNKAFPEAVSKIPSFSLQLKKIISNFREQIIKILLGSEYNFLKVGRFRCSGENHQWMYDRVSLYSILEECGFVKIVQQDPGKSYISNWAAFNLDTEPDGTTYKPDSLYMEAVKP